MKLNHQSYIESNSDKLPLGLRFDVYLADNFDGLQNVNQVYGIILNHEKDQIRIVKLKSGEWSLPGGSIEDGETFVDTLKREIKEETNLELVISSIKPLFYQDAYIKNEKGEYDYSVTQLRYLAIADKDAKFESDPDNADVVANKWIKIKDLEKYINWGETTKMIKEMLNKFKL